MLFLNNGSEQQLLLIPLCVPPFDLCSEFEIDGGWLYNMTVFFVFVFWEEHKTEIYYLSASWLAPNRQCSILIAFKDLYRE